MKNPRPSKLTLCVVGLVVAGCSATPDGEPAGDANSQSDDRLTGGDQLAPSAFPATLFVGGCTAAKVGPRQILLGAHCIYEPGTSTIKPLFMPGATFKFYTDKVIDKYSKPMSATVETTAIHSQWVASCYGTCSAAILTSEVPPDIAVIVTKDEIAGIPAAAIDAQALVEKDPVVIMGYGCESGLDGPMVTQTGVYHLKAEHTVVLPGSAVDHPSTFIPSTDPRYPKLLGSYFFTPGMAMDSTAASLCIGDSGGPVYRDDGSQAVIVGVNAYYSFITGQTSVPYINWHTRVDQSSRFQIASWLYELGVSVIGWPSTSSGTTSTEQQPADPCQGLTYEGMCDGNIVRWCDGGPKAIDCGAEGRACGWNATNGYYDCI